MKKNYYFSIKTCVLFLLLAMSSICTFAQNLKQYRFGIFTINLPYTCKLMQEENNVGMVCKTYNTPNKKFIYTYCIFTIDEDFDLKERLKEEALGMNIDIDEVGYFAVTTGTESPLLSTMALFDDFALTMGIYPHYEKGKAIFVCLVDAEKKDVSNLVSMMSTFRPIK